MYILEPFAKVIAWDKMTESSLFRYCQSCACVNLVQCHKDHFNQFSTQTRWNVVVVKRIICNNNNRSNFDSDHKQKTHAQHSTTHTSAITVDNPILIRTRWLGCGRLYNQNLDGVNLVCGLSSFLSIEKIRYSQHDKHDKWNLRLLTPQYRLYLYRWRIGFKKGRTI